MTFFGIFFGQPGLDPLVNTSVLCKRVSTQKKKPTTKHHGLVVLSTTFVGHIFYSGSNIPTYFQSHNFGPIFCLFSPIYFSSCPTWTSYITYELYLQKSLSCISSLSCSLTSIDSASSYSYQMHMGLKTYLWFNSAFLHFFYFFPSVFSLLFHNSLWLFACISLFLVLHSVRFFSWFPFLFSP